MNRVDSPVKFLDNAPEKICNITNEEKISLFNVFTFKFNTDSGLQYAKRTS